MSDTEKADMTSEIERLRERVAAYEAALETARSLLAMLRSDLQGCELSLASTERRATISSQRAEIRDLKARLDAALALAGKHICPHEERHRGGVIWEFCDNCDAKWADDEGGFKPNPDAALLEAIADTKNKNWRKP